MDIEIDFNLETQMQSLSINNIICEEIEETDNIICDMQNLSIDEKAEFMNELFENNLDVYSVYSEIKDTENKLNPVNYHIDMKLSKYNILRVIGVPNVYCDGDNFDDEDFVYYLFKLPEHLSHLVRNDNTVEDIDNTLINFTDTMVTPEIIYHKVVYIYQFVHYYYTTLSTLPFKKRVNHLPYDYLSWVYNIIDIIRKTINIENMYSTLCIYCISNTETYDGCDGCDGYDVLENKEHYFKDLVYGLNLCVCHLKMILNYNQSKNIYFWDMEEKYIEKLFRILNNLCIIVIYMKHGF